MNCTVTIDWKFVVALGGTVTLFVFASKIDGTAAERVLTHAVDTCKELAVALKGNR